MKINTRDEAVAFAKFLVCEKLRHLEDIRNIDKLLLKLSKEWELEISEDTVEGCKITIENTLVTLDDI